MSFGSNPFLSSKGLYFFSIIYLLFKFILILILLYLIEIQFSANNPFGGETEKNPFQKASKTPKQIFGGPNTEKSGFTNGLNLRLFEMFSKTKIKIKSFLKVKII